MEEKDTRTKLESELYSDNDAQVFVGRYKGKNRLIWGKGPTSSVDMTTKEFEDFLHAVTDAVKRLDARKSRKTESLSRAASDSNKRIWGYHNGDVQLQWGTLLRKTPEAEFRKFAAVIGNVLDILKKKDLAGKKQIARREKAASIHFYIGFMSLFLMGLSLIATFLFALFLMEFIALPLATFLGALAVFIIMLFLQQENLSGFLDQCRREWRDTVVPMLANVPVHSRKGIELGIIMLIAMVFLGFYFAKALPSIMNSKIFSIM